MMVGKIGRKGEKQEREEKTKEWRASERKGGRRQDQPSI